MSIKPYRRIAMLAAKSFSEKHDLDEFFSLIKNKDPSLLQNMNNFEDLSTHLIEYESLIEGGTQWSNISELLTEQNILSLFNALLVIDLKRECFWPIRVIPEEAAGRAAAPPPESGRRTWFTRRAGLHKRGVLKNKKNSKNKNFKTRKGKGTKKYSKNKNFKTRKGKGTKKKKPIRR